MTVCADAAAVAKQEENWLPSVTAGIAGTLKLELRTAVTFEPPTRTPLDPEVKPTVHVDSAAPVCGAPA